MLRIFVCRNRIGDYVQRLEWGGCMFQKYEQLEMLISNFVVFLWLCLKYLVDLISLSGRRKELEEVGWENG